MKSSPPRPCTVNDPSRHGTCSTQSRSSVTLLEHSPLLDEVLRQITNSRESVLDIRTQLAEYQSASTRSHAVLQREVETYRERKQQEDAARLELKSRTKLLDDSKRGAEGTKKDAERSLKAVQLVRDNSGHHLESLHQKIFALQGHLLEDRDFIFYYQKQSLDHGVNDTLEQKKAEIQAAEHSVAILNQRSRELEDKLSSERERLRILREKSDNQKSCYPFLEDMDLLSQHYDRRSHSLHPTIAYGSSLSSSSFLTPDGGEDLPTTPDSQILHHPRNSDLHNTFGTAFIGNAEANSLSEVHQDAPSESSQESEVVSTAFGSGLNTGFILPRGHAEDDGGCKNLGFHTRFFQVPDHCPAQTIPKHQGGYPSLSTIPIFTPTLVDSDRSFETLFQSYNGPNCARPAKFDVEYTNWTQSLDVDLPAPFDIPGNILDQSQPTRSLASTTSLSTNEFSFFDNPGFELSNDTGNASPNLIFDALNPNGLGSAFVSPPSTSQSLLRAFAPSPAEREALQRALSGSTNASLEKLPSLSVVGSLPSSPASPHMRGLPQHSHSLRDLRSFLPTWLKAFPHSGTVKFSPWEEEDSRNGDQYITVDQSETQNNAT